MYDIPCVIFAGGKSSRMGEDKALLPFATFSTLTEYQYSRLKKIFTNVFISTKSSDKFNFEANFILDLQDSSNQYAPTSGFIAAFSQLNVDRFFVLSVDSPFIGKYEIQRLIDSDKDNYDATIAKTDRGMQPMCGIYHSSLSKSFTNMHKSQNHKLGFLLKNSLTNYLYFEDETPFLNLNHPYEYQEALNRVKSNS